MVLGFPMLFAKDIYNKYRPEYFSPAMREAFGLNIERRILVREEHDVKGLLSDQILRLGNQIEEHIVTHSQVKATFRDGPLVDGPLLTTNSDGQGRACYLTGYPNARAMQIALHHRELTSTSRHGATDRPIDHEKAVAKHKRSSIPDFRQGPSSQ